jgi:Tfp pilus assembly protein PilV
MVRLKSMVIVMIATLVMGLGFSAMAILHAGAPQNAVDASKLHQSHLAGQRAAHAPESGAGSN